MSETIRGTVSASGRVVIPAELRRDFGIEPGAEVVFSRTEYGIQIMPLDQTIRRAQALVRQYIPAEINLVAQLRELRHQDDTFA